MNIGRSLQFTFEDEQWLSKLGLGALIWLVPILNFAWIGYYIEIMRNVTEGRELPLPTWDDLGDKFMKGLLVTVAGFIYALPGLILLCLPLGILFVPAFIQDQDIQGIVATFTTISGLAMMCLIGIYFLAFSFIMPAVQLRFSKIGTIRSCFQLREIVQLISKNLSDYLVGWLIVLVAGLFISVVVGGLGALMGWIPCLGQLLVWILGAAAGVWFSAVYGHIFGQFGAKALTGSEILAPTSE